jgi:hypothetical protein
MQQVQTLVIAAYGDSGAIHVHLPAVEALEYERQSEHIWNDAVRPHHAGFLVRGGGGLLDRGARAR